ncbi:MULTISPECIES: hypothetical protein [Actinomyces]|uniref:Uncharacterized protein n=1 Tax=Actinomyces respiraculi TaxID=2744574 RepID=A0A7T0LLW7_9ACTO|nr:MULTISPECIES: hypothetical protein [Actinomyces]QPL06032.1 hypothetical protein ID810_03555 [Actinomyces respiraculi]
MIVWEECSDAEVTALVKALHEARFADEPNDPLLWQSPIVIDLHVQAIAEQQQRRAERQRAGKSDPQAWLLWRNRPEQGVVTRRLVQDPALIQLAREDGGQVLRDLLRPFILDDNDVRTLLQGVEDHEHT